MTQAIFISETWLKINTPIPYNLDPSEVYPFYRTAQDKYIRDVLGDNLYNALSAALIGGTLTANQTTLIETFRPALGYYIVYEAILFLASKIKNIGVVDTADDKQTASAAIRVKELRQEIQDTAEYYMTRVTKYLCNNSSLFPEYTQHSDDINANHNAGYNCDLYIDPCFMSKRIWRDGRWYYGDDIDENFLKQYYRD